MSVTFPPFYGSGFECGQPVRVSITAAGTVSGSHGVPLALNGTKVNEIFIYHPNFLTLFSVFNFKP
jgi:hypothetical protein